LRYPNSFTSSHSDPNIKLVPFVSKYFSNIFNHLKDPVGQSYKRSIKVVILLTYFSKNGMPEILGSWISNF